MKGIIKDTAKLRKKFRNTGKYYKIMKMVEERRNREK